MVVEKIVFCGNEWIGFLGQRSESDSKKNMEETQFFEIFSQHDIGVCLVTLKFEKGRRVCDVAVKSMEVFAIACEDGSV